jgi:hypothetical protein
MFPSLFSSVAVGVAFANGKSLTKLLPSPILNLLISV